MQTKLCDKRRFTPLDADSSIQVINQLQELVLQTVGLEVINLPQVVVVGSQSTGKSSVIESIVGRDFLPRGTGIVTRRPLILQLCSIAQDHICQVLQTGNCSLERAEFIHAPGKNFASFREVKAEIEYETARVAGSNKGVCKDPILLKIYSPHMLNLTLIDLPGLTKIPIGDQPPDIDRQINSIVMKYISNPNSIILAVSAANIDLVTSEALKVARKSDPLGLRTVGVLTKLDLMDTGTNAFDVLSGKIYALKLGFVGLVCRSQKDNKSQKSLQQALEAEKHFFATRSEYKSANLQCGAEFLSKTLQRLLVQHIRQKLPDIKAKLDLLIASKKREVEKYGDYQCYGLKHKGTIVLQFITKFANAYVHQIDGMVMDCFNKLCGGARIYLIFDTIFRKELYDIDPISNLSLDNINTAIRNSSGPRASLFVPEFAFDLLIKPQISLLMKPSIRCAELVNEELIRVCLASADSDYSQFPNLEQSLTQVGTDLIRERLAPTLEYIKVLIDIEKSYINSNHPDFIGGSGALRNIAQSQVNSFNGSDQSDVEINKGDCREELASHEKSRLDSGNKESFLSYLLQKKGKNKSELPLNTHDEYLSQELDQALLLNAKKQNLCAKDQIDAEIILTLIGSYFNLVRKNILDHVPKAIMHLMVNNVKGNIQNKMVSELYRDDRIDFLLQEDQKVSKQREKCIEALQSYHEASKVIMNTF